jgi:hypothetical protein
MKLKILTAKGKKKQKKTKKILKKKQKILEDRAQKKLMSCIVIFIF